jgi:hypothetical protein
MSSDMSAAPRANRGGHPCPPWCVTDHNELEVPWDRSFGYQLIHASGPMRAGQGFVTLLQDGVPGAEAKVSIDVPSPRPHMRVSLSMPPRQAQQVALLLDAVHSQPELAAQVRAAAATALEAQR